MRRATDVVLAFLFGLALLPVIAGVAAVVLLTAGRPVLFLQARIARGGRSFRIVKFRTMAPAPGGPRVTAVGDILRRYSLDELPGLWNVLLGDMALVGPRPLVADEQPADPSVRRLRQSVRPGITGWAQVSGPDGILPARKFALDLHWIGARGPRFDTRILWRTLLCVLAGRRPPDRPAEKRAEVRARPAKGRAAAA